jgi:glycolate oxidase iron-sulfur subunit
MSHLASTGQAPELRGVEDKILACVHCGFCLSACPTYTRLGDESDSPRGRIYLMRAVAEGRLPEDDTAFHRHIDQCLGCRACEPVCPSGVEYGHLLERARATIARAAGTSLPTRALLFAFGNNTPRTIVSALSRLLRGTGIPALLVRLLPKSWNRSRFAMAMLASTAPWPQLKRAHLRAPERPSARTPERPKTHERVRVAMLQGCVQQGLFGHVNHATAAVLQRNNCELADAPNQGCCGALHAHTGAYEQARALARHNIESFEQSGAEAFVVNAAGCGAMMKDYGDLLHDDPAWRERAAALALKVKDVSEFLLTRGPVRGAPLALRVTYDAPCHLLHAQRITHAPIDVLRAIPELEMIPLPAADECCGGAGIYGLLHQELGGRILRDKVNAAASTGADVLVTPNPGCMMQIGAGLRLSGHELPVLHPIELLAESYRRAE